MYGDQGGNKLAAAILIIIVRRHADIGPLGFNSQISRIKTALQWIKNLKADTSQIVKQYKG